MAKTSPSGVAGRGAGGSGAAGRPMPASSPMRHVAVMALTGTIGIMAVFAVDLVNFFYLSRLGDKAVAAAVGFADAAHLSRTSSLPASEVIY